MSLEETKDLAYWERNMLALMYAQGWYNDDIMHDVGRPDGVWASGPRYEGWRRVLTIDDGMATFHIPDDFDVGATPEVKPNWDGHTTEEKWRRMMHICGVEETP